MNHGLFVVVFLSIFAACGAYLIVMDIYDKKQQLREKHKRDLEKFGSELG